MHQLMYEVLLPKLMGRHVNLSQKTNSFMKLNTLKVIINLKEIRYIHFWYTLIVLLKIIKGNFSNWFLYRKNLLTDFIKFKMLQSLSEHEVDV